MTNLKKVIIAVLTVALLATICSAVFASDDFGIIPDGNTTVVENPNGTGNTNTNTNEPTVVNPAGTLSPTNTNTNTNTNTSTYNNTNTSNLPKTGVGDYTMVTAIILLAIVAVYAYKKVRDYKNI